MKFDESAWSNAQSTAVPRLNRAEALAPAQQSLEQGAAKTLEEI